MDSDDPPADTAPDGGTVQPADPDVVAEQVGEDAVAATVPLSNGNELPIALSDDVVDAARREGVDVGSISDAVADVPDDVDFAITASRAKAAADDTATIPVKDGSASHLNDDANSYFRFGGSPEIRNLLENSIDYTDEVGRFLLARDDLIPSVKERIKALIVGSDGMSVEPADPDNDADQKLANHLEDLYDDDIRPTEVIDAILRENMMEARAVLRATDLAELDLSTLDYLKDGVTGEEIYLQEQTTVYEFDVDEGTKEDPGDIDVEQRLIDPQPLVIGEQVFDISLYDSPPLEAVADTVINKMVMQRLKARKAELTSFGAVYAKIEPPSYLPEEQYFDRIADDNWDGKGKPPTKLERALKQNMEKAFDHLKEWQSGTTMAIPDYWTLEQIEIPDTGTPLDDQIRGYNKSIARRLLVPLDLIELREGAELSRETLFRTLLTTINGWRQEIIRVFDQFAETQAEIHDLGGDVNHNFPPIENQDEQTIIKALKHAGVAGLTEKEVRKMLNNIEGVDLDTEDASTKPANSPPAGGPKDPAARQDQMQNFLKEQNDRGKSPDDKDADDATAADAGGNSGNVQPAGSGGSSPTARAGSDGPTGRARKLLQTVPFLPDPGDGPVDVSEAAIKEWLAWVRAGRPSLQADWNPALHPRGPDGRFIERPYDVPDAIRDEIDDMDTATALDRLAGTSEMGEDDIDALLQDPGVNIDGIPDDANTRKDLFEISQDDSPPDDGTTSMAEQGYVSPGAPDMRLGNADEVNPLLEDDEGQSGSAATNMDVAHFDDGTTAFIKHYRDDLDGDRADGEKPVLAEREVAADRFLRNIGMGDHLPGLFNNEAESYSASEKLEGEHPRTKTPAGAADLDEERFKDFAAATMLAGNSDLHGDNWVVQDDGSFAAIDLNKSGGDFSTPGKFRNRGRNMIMHVSDQLNIDWNADDLADRAGELAQEIDVDAALEGVPNSDISDAARHQFRENIRKNIEAFAAGEVSL